MRPIVETIAALAFATSLMGSDVQAALEDRATFPPPDAPYLYYVTTAASLPHEREALEASLKLVIASTSLQPVVERCVPHNVTPTLFRLDLRDLQWDWRIWHSVIKEYPYDVHNLPLVLRADWLLLNITDQHTNGNYTKLLLGTAPKTRDEWLGMLGVDPNPVYRFGLIEEDSGVSKQRIRWIENRPISRGYAWGTRDVLEVNSTSDPLQHLAGDFKHDGEEWIVGIPKVSMKTGQRGTLQVYVLANGQGQLVDRAPVDLVEDKTEFRGNREIRVCGSCIQCHAQGLNDPTLNGLRQLITVGADVYSYPREQAESIEQFHLGDITKEMERNKEDYATIVQEVCRMRPEDVAFSFKLSTELYDLPVTQDRAAYELSTTPERLKLAIANYSAKYKETPARMVSLAHGLPIPRSTFEEQFLTIQSAVKDWENN